VYRETRIGDEVLILSARGSALAKSHSDPRGWHAVRVGRCDCDSFARNGSCRHEMALRHYLGIDIDDEPTAFDWLVRRQEASR
jgi:hypothetical protein